MRTNFASIFGCIKICVVVPNAVMKCVHRLFLAAAIECVQKICHPEKRKRGERRRRRRRSRRRRRKMTRKKDKDKKVEGGKKTRIQFSCQFHSPLELESQSQRSREEEIWAGIHFTANNVFKAEILPAFSVSRVLRRTLRITAIARQLPRQLYSQIKLGYCNQLYI